MSGADWRAPSALFAATLSLGVLAGCSDDQVTETAETGASRETLATALAEAENFTDASTALNETGLAAVFDGPGSYTLLVPDDAAFAALGAARERIMAEDQRAVLVALLRNHIVPGQIDVESVRQAIAAKQGAVRMRTLGGGSVAFSLEGEKLIVASEGQEASVDTGKQVIASNGTLFPIDAVLVRPPAAQ